MSRWCRHRHRRRSPRRFQQVAPAFVAGGAGISSSQGEARVSPKSHLPGLQSVLCAVSVVASTGCWPVHLFAQRPIGCIPIVTRGRGRILRNAAHGRCRNDGGPISVIAVEGRARLMTRSCCTCRRVGISIVAGSPVLGWFSHPVPISQESLAQVSPSSQVHRVCWYSPTALHKSGAVQAFPSSHGVLTPSGVEKQPVMPPQASTVHGFPSSQFRSPAPTCISRLRHTHHPECRHPRHCKASATLSMNTAPSLSQESSVHCSSSSQTVPALRMHQPTRCLPGAGISAVTFRPVSASATHPTSGRTSPLCTHFRHRNSGRKR